MLCEQILVLLTNCVENMSFQVNIPPTMTARLAKSEEMEKPEEEETPAAGKKREDWKKLKELEEARKAGTAPAMQDEEGK